MRVMEDLAAEVAKIKWFHTIDLGNGIITPGADTSPLRLEMLHLPEDLGGKTVLDIGSWDGFFAFECERRGASRVLATDSYCWNGQGWGSKEGFNLARRALDSRVEDMEIDVLDLSPDRVGVFDLVLCLGVLYHLRDPLLALERISRVTGDRLILDTHVDLLMLNRPAIAFYEGRELNDDPTNWCGPNPAAVKAMLRTVGFSRVEIVSHQLSRTRRLARAVKRSLLYNESFTHHFWQDRMVFHARR